MNGSDLPYKGKTIIFFTHDSPGYDLGTASKYYYPIIASKLGANVCVVGDFYNEDKFPRCIKTYSVSKLNAISRIFLCCKLINKYRPSYIHVYFHRWCFIYGLVAILKKGKALVDVRGPLQSKGFKRFFSRLINLFELRFFDLVAGHSFKSIETVFGIGASHDAVFTSIGVNNNACPLKRMDQAEYRFVYIGSIDRRRNLDALIKAFISIKDDKRIYLDVIGDGDALAELKEIVADSGASNINFIGSVKHEAVSPRLVEYFSGISFINSGVLDSGPPLKTLEYFSAGLPVLASDTYGNRMLVDEFENGIFIKKNNELGIIESVYELIDYSEYDSMSSNSYRKSILFLWDAVVMRGLDEIFEKLRI